MAKLDRQIAQRILRFLNERVALLDDPRQIGEALKGSTLGAFWKYRVGDYRIIAHIDDGAVRDPHRQSRQSTRGLPLGCSYLNRFWFHLCPSSARMMISPLKNCT